MDINNVTLTGNLTRDPELRTLPSGSKVCQLRIAVDGREKRGDEWVQRPNYFDVNVWGNQGEQCATYLSKGRGIVLRGELRWREWEDANASAKRQAVDIVAREVKFQGSPEGKQQNGNGAAASASARSDVPADARDLPADPQPATVGGGGDDDLPF
jgi:single-strand DNA-binding protein